MLRILTTRFGWVSRSAMIVAMVVAAALNVQMQGGGFWGGRGVPFTWYEWSDAGPPFDLYHPFGFLGDALIALSFIAAVGIVAERLHRSRSRWLSILTLVGTATLAAMLLSATKSGPDFGIRGTPFDWFVWSRREPGIHGYYWWGLLGDLLVAFVLVGFLACIIESTASRLFGPRRSERQYRETA